MAMKEYLNIDFCVEVLPHSGAPEMFVSMIVQSPKAQDWQLELCLLGEGEGEGAISV